MTTQAPNQPSQEPRPWRFLALLFGSAFLVVGLIRFATSDGEEVATVATSATSVGVSVASAQATDVPFVEHGKQLFDSMGCAACHGAEGSGVINNLNYVLGSVPSLNEMADRMMLFDPEDAVAAVELLEQGTDLASLESAPPFPDFARFVAQYGAVEGVIKNGAPAAKKDPAGIAPPLQMPAWEERLSDDDIRALVAYLIELYDWEE